MEIAKTITAVLMFGFYIKAVLFMLFGKEIEGALILIAVSIFDWVNKDLFIK